MVSTSSGSQRAEQVADATDGAQHTRGAKKRAAAAKRKALAGHVAAAVAAPTPPVRKKEKLKGKGNQKQIIGKGGGNGKGGGKNEGGAPACFDHNKGPDGCKRITCKYRHVCTGCGSADHIKPNCSA